MLDCGARLCPTVRSSPYRWRPALSHPISYVVEPYSPELSGFVYETWTRDYSRQPSNRRMPSQAYYPYQRGVIDQLLERGAQVLVAYDAEQADQAYGWLCCELDGPALVLHYVYVKLPFRELGIGHALLTAALERFGEDVSELVYTHDPARGRDETGKVDVSRREQVAGMGFSWRPIDEHLRGARSEAA